MSTARARWPTAAADHPCPICGHANACKIAPDGTAAACWHDGHGGKVIQLAHINGNSNSSNGHMRTQFKFSNPGKAFCTLAEASAAAKKLAEDKAGQSATPGGQWLYRDAEDERDLMAVLRFDLADGDKAIFPLKPSKGGGWKIGDPPEPLPLYRLPELADGNPVFICEGEKAALAGASIGLISTTSSHGASSAGRSDWRPLAGRKVVILPDHDSPGEGYAREVSRNLLKLEPPAQVKIIRLPGLPAGGDIVEFIASRRPADNDTIREEIETLADAAPVLDPADVLGGPVLTCLADVQAKPIEWLWPGKIPAGCITLWIGAPKVGKSFATLDTAARVSTGSPWPDGSGNAPLGSVILITAEDDPERVIRPRLDAHRADCRRVHHLSLVRRVDAEGKKFDVMFTLIDVAALEAVLRSQPDCKLVVIDPIGSFLGGDTDAHRDNEVRGVLAPVARMAERQGCAVLVVAHRRKGGGNVADDLALGSRAFTGLARANWHLSRDPKDKARRLLLPGGGNYFDDSVSGLAFTIAGNPPAICWEREAVAKSADEALAEEQGENDGPGRPDEQRSEATDWLGEELFDLAEHPVATIREAAESAGYAWRTVQRASKELRVLCHRASFGGGYVWRLPKPGTDAPTPCVPESPAHACQIPKSENIGTHGTHGELSQKRCFSEGEGGGESHACQNDCIGTHDENGGEE